MENSKEEGTASIVDSEVSGRFVAYYKSRYVVEG